MDNRHDVNLNIHYTAPDEIWEKIHGVYQNMPYWRSFEPIPHWTGNRINLSASGEPSGLQISGEMPEEVWENWYKMLKDNLTHELGYEIGEPEDGFPFKYWTPFIKNYSDLKSMDAKAIVFHDSSIFYFDEFTMIERYICANPPYFSFRSEYIELRIIFNKSGLFARKQNIKDFHELYDKLNKAGKRTRDLS